MNNLIRILAPEELSDILNSAGKKYNLEIELFSEAEDRLIEKISCLQPDVVIMNLFMRCSDAIDVIKSYRMLYSGSFTYFAVICQFITGSLKKELDDCRVNMIIRRPYLKRDFIAILSEVTMIKSTPLVAIKNSGINTVHMFHHRRMACGTEYVDSSDLELDKILEEFGLNKNDAGCIYLKRAVALAISMDKADCSMTKTIYPLVAVEFGITPSCVLRRIHNAIAESWNSEHSAIMASYFGDTVDNMRGIPTNGEFIAMLADRIRLDKLCCSECDD